MPVSNFTLKNSGEQAYNDTVFNNVFYLEDNFYEVLIVPKTEYWRFGMRFSFSSDIQFYHPEGRYNNPAFADIEFDAGGVEAGKWVLPNRLELSCYNLPPYPNSYQFDRYEDYRPQQPVKINFAFDKRLEVLTISYTTGPYYGHQEKIELKGYRHFMFFGWADNTAYEMDVQIQWTSMAQTKQAGPDVRSNCWFLKLDTDNWNIEKFAVNHPYFHNTYVYDRERTPPVFVKRLEYDLFMQVRKGDSIIGYAMEDINAVVCLFEVTGPITNVDPSGEKIDFVIKKIYSEPIHLESFVTKIDFADDLTRQSATRLIAISAETYEAITGEKPVIPSGTNDKADPPDMKSRLHSDSYDAQDEDVLNFDLIAENLFTILTDLDTNPPLNIGILAPWGRGKTTLMKRIQKRFDTLRHEKQIAVKKEQTTIADNETGELEKKITNATHHLINIPSLWKIIRWLKTNKPLIQVEVPYPTVWFNPWNYQSTDMIWGGLAYAIIEQVVSQIPSPADRELFRLQLRLARLEKEDLRKDLHWYFIRLLVFAGLGIVMAIVLFSLFLGTAYSIPSGIGALISLAGSGKLIYDFVKENSKAVTKKLASYDKPLQYLNKLGTFHEVEADLKKVFETLVKGQTPVTVFVDDLDRCAVSKVVEVVEAINVFINSDAYKHKCYFILGMDAEMVAGALDVSYSSMKGKIGAREMDQGSVGWYFLDKFIQLPFFIPVMSETKKQEYLRYLLSEKKNTPGNGALNQNKVKGVFDAIMATDDKQKSAERIKEAGLTDAEQKELDRKILKNQVETEAQNETIRNQAARYCRFISSDPRAVKRFTNLLRFYSSYQFLRMKKNEPYAEIPVLAKWLALMVKFPQLVRWIQWDAENSTGYNSTAEDKAVILDGLVTAFTSNHSNPVDHYDAWKTVEFNPAQITEMKELEKFSWLRSKSFFLIIMNEYSPAAHFKNALDCNVW